MFSFCFHHRFAPKGCPRSYVITVACQTANASVWAPQASETYEIRPLIHQQLSYTHIGASNHQHKGQVQGFFGQGCRDEE